jgi:prepilin-type N-terminal cleavage/methylation domain-containing protein
VPAKGFTLVELLVVLTILGMLMALVGPLTVDQFERARAQEEWLVLQRTADSLAFRAFTDGRDIELRGEGGTLAWQATGGEEHVLEFRQLFFDPKQQVLINSNGIAVPGELALRQRDRERRLPLNAWLDDAK